MRPSLTTSNPSRKKRAAAASCPECFQGSSTKSKKVPRIAQFAPAMLTLPRKPVKQGTWRAGEHPNHHAGIKRDVPVRKQFSPASPDLIVGAPFFREIVACRLQAPPRKIYWKNEQHGK